MALHQLVPKLANMCLGETRVAPELTNLMSGTPSPEGR
jgi:hypothetical protein